MKKILIPMLLMCAVALTACGGIKFPDEKPAEEVAANFATDTWARIAELSPNASEHYKIGDEKEIQIGDDTYVVQILGFNHDDLSNGTKAGITIGLKELLNTKYQMHNKTINSMDSYQNSVMRTTLENICNELPDELRNVIKPVFKKVDNVTVSDRLWLFSETELYGNNQYGRNEEGSQYQYFAENETLIKHSNGEAAHWWLRSVTPSGTFCVVTSTGTALYDQGMSEWGVCFGFCV